MTIIADSLEDAKAKAESMAWDEDFLTDLGLDDVDDARVCRVSRAPRMYRVIRDGKPIQASWLEDGDLPREPDERGF